MLTRGVKWEVRGPVAFWLGEQRGDEWKQKRVGRLGSSSVGAALQHSHFESASEVSMRMLGVTPPKEMNEAMLQGVIHEDEIREEYERFTGNRVREIGIAVRTSPFGKLGPSGSIEESSADAPPPFPTHLIAVSPDGLVGDDGMIEVKYAQRPYRPLVEGCEMHELDTAHARGDFGCLRHFIWKTHYDQMQLSMVTLGRTWCDYVVKEATTKILRVVRVPIDIEYWNDVMFPGLVKFFTAHQCAAQALENVGKKR